MARTVNGIKMAQVSLHTPASPRPRVIGWLSEVGDNLRLSFARDYLDDVDRPTLSQLYRGADEGQTRAIMTALNDERLVRIRALPAYFSNLLPEGFNRDRLAQARGCDVDDELELLAAAGADLSGAVEVGPGLDVPQDVLELHATKHLEPLDASAVAVPVENGFSLDGVQTKFSMVEKTGSEGRRYVVRQGAEAGDFLGKLPSIRHPDLARNEGTCYDLARAVGIKTAEGAVRPIAEFDGPASLAEHFSEFMLVRRFDRVTRPDGTTGRVHFEELTQALGLPSKAKYQRMPDAMRAMLTMLKTSESAGQKDIDEFFRRWTAYALMGNTDAHSKNWGFLYPDGVNAVLAPAYDIVCVAAYFDPDQPNHLAFNRKMDESLRAWDEDEAESLAKSAGLLTFNRARRIVRETRALAAQAWPSILESAPDAVRTTINQRLRDLVPSQTASESPPKRRAKP